jgi:hypothetical protein
VRGPIGRSLLLLFFPVICPGVAKFLALGWFVGAVGLEVTSSVAPVALAVVLPDRVVNFFAIFAFAVLEVEAGWYAFMDPKDLVVFNHGAEKGSLVDGGAKDLHCWRWKCLSRNLMVRLVEPIPLFIPVGLVGVIIK